MLQIAVMIYKWSEYKWYWNKQTNHIMLWSSSPFPKCAVEPNLISCQMWSICISLMCVWLYSLSCFVFFFLFLLMVCFLPTVVVPQPHTLERIQKTPLLFVCIQNVLQCFVCVLAVSITENGHDGGRQEELLLGRDPGDRSEVLQDAGGHWKGEDGVAGFETLHSGLESSLNWA